MNTATGEAMKLPKFLRIEVQSSGDQNVNIKVPFQLLRSGIRLASLLPTGVQEQVNGAIRESGVDIDLSKIKPEELEKLVNDLAELTIDVDSGKEKVKIFCE